MYEGCIVHITFSRVFPSASLQAKIGLGASGSMYRGFEALGQKSLTNGFFEILKDFPRLLSILWSKLFEKIAKYRTPPSLLKNSLIKRRSFLHT